jgi:hypothetical protein
LTEGPFVPGWFELWNLYDKWSKHYTSFMATHPNTRGKRGEATKAMNAHPNTAETRRRNGEKSKVRDSKRVRCVTTSSLYPSASEASRVTGINRGHICECCRGERKTAGGHSWVYVG